MFKKTMQGHTISATSTGNWTHCNYDFGSFVWKLRLKNDQKVNAYEFYQIQPNIICRLYFCKRSQLLFTIQSDLIHLPNRSWNCSCIQ